MRLKSARQEDQNVNFSPIISSVVVHNFSAVAYVPESFISEHCLGSNLAHRIGTLGGYLVVCLHAIVQVRAWLVCLATKKHTSSNTNLRKFRTHRLAEGRKQPPRC
jgi:hypothetical protein